MAAAVLLAVAWPPSTVWGQFGQGPLELSSAVHLDEPDSSTRAHLERVKAYLGDGQWDEAVETLRQVLESAGSQVIELADPKFLPRGDFRRYVSLADYCHAQIAALPAEALDLYRRRVDPLAERWYEEGVAKGQQSALAAVVQQFFCSSYGDEALLALGDLALEHGHPDTARAHWQQLVERPWPTVPAEISQALRTRDELPAVQRELWGHWYQADPERGDRDHFLRTDEPLSDATAASLLATGRSAGIPPTRLAYPSASVPLAEVRARLILASTLAGDLARAADELSAFRRLHPEARGRLAGKEGLLAELLADLVAAADKWEVPKLPDEWPTLAGAPDRNRLGQMAVELGAQAWPPIDLGEPLEARLSGNPFYNTRRPAEDAKGLLSYHPVVVDDLILVSTRSQVLAFNLHTGQPAWPVDSTRPAGEIFADDGDLRTAGSIGTVAGVPRFTLTVHQRKAYARAGSQVTVRPLESFDSRGNYLVCLDLEAQGRLLWKIKPDDEKWSFEGAPLVDGTDVYVALRHNDIRPQAYVACYDSQTRRRRWRTFLCAAEVPGAGVDHIQTHTLLTLHEGRLYCNTNLGAVAAVAAADGHLEWISLYQRARSLGPGGVYNPVAHFHRDLNPCLYHHGRLYVAPADTEAVLALDAANGQFLWEQRLPDVVHLLGAGSGHLLAAGDRLYWLDLARGGYLQAPFPEQGKGTETILGYGRGLLSAGSVYWPTRERLYVFDQSASAAGRQRAPIPLVNERGASGGNLVLAGGYLLIAGPDKLYGFRVAGGSADKARGP
jgi:outer membrane protein assembly factor BamB